MISATMYEMVCAKEIASFYLLNLETPNNNSVTFTERPLHLTASAYSGRNLLRHSPTRLSLVPWRLVRDDFSKMGHEVTSDKYAIPMEINIEM